MIGCPLEFKALETYGSKAYTSKAFMLKLPWGQFPFKSFPPLEQQKPLVPQNSSHDPPLLHSPPLRIRQSLGFLLNSRVALWGIPITLKPPNRLVA